MLAPGGFHIFRFIDTGNVRKLLEVHQHSSAIECHRRWKSINRPGLHLLRFIL